MGTTFAEPTTRTPTKAPLAPPPAPTSKPVDYHAEPKNIPPIQQQIKKTAQPYSPKPWYDGKPSGATVGSANNLRAVTSLTSGQEYARGEAEAAFAYAAGVAISGFYDGVTRAYSDEQVGQFAGDSDLGAPYYFGEKAGGKIRDLWENRPTFEIPPVKIPKFERPGLPDIFKPKPQPKPKPDDKPVPGQPKPTVEEPPAQPEPQQKEEDIPQLDKPKPKLPKPLPPPMPGKTRFKLPGSCTGCGASIAFGSTIIDNNSNNYVTKPGMGFMRYLVDGSTPPIGVSESRSYTLAFPTTGDNDPVYYANGLLPSENKYIEVLHCLVGVSPQQMNVAEANGCIDLKMPTRPNGTPINWELMHINCGVCEYQPIPESPPTLQPPPEPPEDCDCMAKCCPDIDYRKIQKMIEDAVENLALATPDSWLIRPEHHRPQMIVQFGEMLGNKKVGSPKYPLTIPHPKPSKPNKSAIPAYKKGNWEIIFVLKDNSKITIHALNEIEGMKVLNAAKALVLPDYVNGGYLSKSGKVITKTPLEQITVTPKMAKYFPDGRKSQKPEWIVKF